MNIVVFLAGLVAGFATIGHFIIGSREFLKPVMGSQVEEIPKRVMMGLFHYMSVFMVLTTIILISLSLGCNLIFENPDDILKFIAVTYGGYAIAQLIIALTAPVKQGLIKLFQWVFWMVISILIFIDLFCII